jgi:uncharacterized membrane protein YvbJ
MAGFCPNCGTPAGDDAIFCGGCGTKLAEAIAAALASHASTPTTSGASPGTATAPSGIASAGTTTPSKRSGCGQELLIVVLVFALLVVVGVGIAIYLAHQAK